MVVTDGGTERFLINCTATGIPVPNVTWRDPDGMELPNVANTRITLLPEYNQGVTFDGLNFVHRVTQLLQITNTSDKDSGMYTCVADNSVGQVDSGTVTVFVRGT